VATFPVTGLTLEMRRTDDGQYYLYGVVVDGVFVRLFVTKTGGIDDDLARAADAAAATAAVPPVEPPVTTSTL
jgi:hypothetical protein